MIKKVLFVESVSRTGRELKSIFLTWTLTSSDYMECGFYSQPVVLTTVLLV